jgi:hypothetical protein
MSCSRPRRIPLRGLECSWRPLPRNRVSDRGITTPLPECGPVARAHASECRIADIADDDTIPLLGTELVSEHAAMSRINAVARADDMIAVDSVRQRPLAESRLCWRKKVTQARLVIRNRRRNMGEVQNTTPEMTLRDWFAGNALVALDYWSTRDKFPLLKDGLTYEQLIAHHAYAMADALLAERGKRGVMPAAEAASEGRADGETITLLDAERRRRLPR